jgi:hypothetical protein
MVGSVTNPRSIDALSEYSEYLVWAAKRCEGRMRTAVVACLLICLHLFADHGWAAEKRRSRAADHDATRMRRIAEQDRRAVAAVCRGCEVTILSRIRERKGTASGRVARQRYRRPLSTAGVGIDPLPLTSRAEALTHALIRQNAEQQWRVSREQQFQFELNQLRNELNRPSLWHSDHLWR